MKIDMYYGMDPSFGPDTHRARGVGGTENFLTYASEHLGLAGHEVRVYNKVLLPTSAEHDVRWLPIQIFRTEESRDVLWALRSRDVFQRDLPKTRLKVLYLADTESHGLGDDIRAGRIDLAMFVGEWQAQKIVREERLLPDQYMITSNGVSMKRFDADRAKEWPRVKGKCIYLSTPERGLEPLLDMWPIIQAGVPEAVLHLFSSFKGWGTTDDENTSMCKQVYERIKEMQGKGASIINHVHANASALRLHLLTSELFLYPTRHFNETCCMAAMEASAAGVPIVATARAALCERVLDGQTGFLVGRDDDKTFIRKTIDLLKDRNVWQSFSYASAAFARSFDYDRLVPNWAHRWQDAMAIRR